MGTNSRGKAKRSNDRNTRYATHVPVLTACVDALNASAENPITVVEHGMGLSSTHFFHSLPHVKNIVSFEREIDWLNCSDCNDGSSQPHSMTLLDDDTAIEQATFGINEPERTVGLVDGFASQRVMVLEAWMCLGIVLIVEHDAETFSSGEVRGRRALAQKFGYAAYQYTGRDPETAFFVKQSSGLTLSLTGSCHTF